MTRFSKCQYNIFIKNRTKFKVQENFLKCIYSYIHINQPWQEIIDNVMISLFVQGLVNINIILFWYYQAYLAQRFIYVECNIFTQREKWNNVCIIRNLCLKERKNLFSLWTYDRLLSNASIEKNDLSLMGFIIGILCLISIFSSLILRFSIYFYGKIFSEDESSIHSPSISSTTEH